MSGYGTPPGWAMPDDLAKKVSEALNKKSIPPEDELQDALEDLTRDLALIEPNPVDWGWWVSYLLELWRKIIRLDFGNNFLYNQLK